MRPIRGRGRAILLADGVDVCRVPQDLDVRRSASRIEHTRGRAPGPEGVLHHRIRCRHQHALGEGLRLRQQRPRPVAERKPCIRALPRRRGRQYVEHGERSDSVGVIEGKAIGDPAPAVVPRHRELPEAKPLHDLHHVARHGALRIRPVGRIRRRTATSAIAPQVGAYHGAAAGQQRRDLEPHQVRLGKAVQQEEGRARTGPTGEDRRVRRSDLAALESIEHTGHPRAVRLRRDPPCGPSAGSR
jgi:hypothetical protein